MQTNREEIHCSSLSWCCFWRSSPRHDSSLEGKAQENEKHDVMNSKVKKPGGWKSMPYVLGNETCERLATFGILANFMVYLRREYHMDQVDATNLINVFAGVSNFAPLLGAFLSDAFIGRFWAIAIGSVASFLGMLALTLTAWIPSLTPSWCPYNRSLIISPQEMASCQKPTGPQMGFLVLSLGLLCIGTAGIRPCSIPFGMDQFDHSTEEGRRGINSYYNWYYTTFTVVVMLSLTVVVYIQDSVSWVWGLGIPAALMLGSILLFIFGMRLFVYVKPQGSIFSSIIRVFVAAFNKRHLELPHGVVKGVYYDPPPSGINEAILPLTNQYSFLNKAAIIQEGELKIDHTPTPESKWTLCSIQEVEEVKCLIRVLPVWASGIICFTAAAQQWTFAVSQAMIMNRHLGPNKFQIPPGSINVIAMLAIGIWVPIYDRFLVPALRKITKHEDGFTLLQRMGIGLVFSVFAMVVAGLVEQKRREAANFHNQTLSVFWLAPQLVMLGIAEGFNFIAQIEFYNKEFPENLRSLATSMFFVTIAGSNYLSSAVVSIVHKFTARHGKPDWLTNDLNQGRVDYFYYLIALLGVLNVLYFIVCAMKYHYKGSNKNLEEKDGSTNDIELHLVKH